MLLSESDLDAIIAAAERTKPQVLIIDSIQTVYRPDIASAPGSVAQVRECTGTLVRMAKTLSIATFLVGHVTKEGVLAGPRVLEHLVDTVLSFEGDRHHAYRILRTTKNRFGSTNEIGVFEMSGAGLVEIPNPSAAFLSERPQGAPGSAVVCAIEGTRPVLLEVQALTSPTPFGMPRRTASGVDYNRLLVLLAVLERRAGLQLSSQDVYVSVAGGVGVEEPAADLGIAVAVASSLRNRAVDERAIFIGRFAPSLNCRGGWRRRPVWDSRALSCLVATGSSGRRDWS
jgi:DNA repair protein RadA/Sms